MFGCMTTDLVAASWDRIDAWLRVHAPRTFASLGAPAAEAEIRAAEADLGLVFPADLVASLRRHDGAAEGTEAFRLPTGDRLLGVREIVAATEFLRTAAADLDEESAEFYWLPGYAQFGSYGVTADGLTVDCRPGGSLGAIGRFFDETGTDFGQADSLGGYLEGVADQLERGPVAGAVMFNGRLIWEWAATGRPDWGDAGDPLPTAAADLAPLEWPAGPTEALRPGPLFGLEELGALIASTSREQVTVAAWRQMRRLAVETGLAKYPEVAAALDAGGRGESVALAQDGPLGLRLRGVIAAAGAQRDSYREWAAQALVVTVCGSPYAALAKSATIRGRLNPDWREELHSDLGGPPLPPVPDDRFWATLGNPAIDTGYYEGLFAASGDGVEGGAG